MGNWDIGLGLQGQEVFTGHGCFFHSWLKIQLSAYSPCADPVLSRFSRVKLFAARWTIAHQAPLSMGFPRQKDGSGLPFPSPGDLPDPGIKPASLATPALAGRFFTTNT